MLWGLSSALVKILGQTAMSVFVSGKVLFEASPHLLPTFVLFPELNTGVLLDICFLPISCGKMAATMAIIYSFRKGSEYLEAVYILSPSFFF